ncbi:MAG: endonuclease/exonuclease/phosphatase family protein [Micropruina sp.]|nr:endonuclease/exonuclease/phosphatase family protein [Micropruina sp.]
MALATLGLLAALPATLATGLRVLSPTTERWAKAAAFIPYGLVFWLPAAVLLALAAVRAWRHRSSGRVTLSLLSLVTVAGLGATIVWHAPAFTVDQQATTTAPLTVVSLNVAQTADPAAVARAAQGADVVVFLEAAQHWAQSMPASFRQEFPYQGPEPGDVEDAVIFSRHPVTPMGPLPTSSMGQWTATVDTPQLGEVRVVGVHPCNPYCRGGLWAQEAATLRGWLADLDRSIPTVVAGDFNAVDDHVTMRALYADGWRSAAHLAGAGFVRTWPANRRIPPMIGIDHVLVDQRLTATAFSTFHVPGTDHLGVRAVIAGTGVQ